MQQLVYVSTTRAIQLGMIWSTDKCEIMTPKTKESQVFRLVSHELEVVYKAKILGMMATDIRSNGKD